MDKKKARFRFLKLLLSKIPVMLMSGASLFFFILAWALDFKVVLLNFLPLAGLIATVGIIISILFTSGEKIAEQAVKEIKNQSQQVRTQELDELYWQLKTGDNDPRNEKLLRDLRSVTDEIRKACVESDTGLDSHTNIDVYMKVDELFRRSIQLLKLSVELSKNALAIGSKSISKQLLRRRENILREVNKSKKHLGKVLLQIQEFNYSLDSDDNDLAAIRKDLDTKLDIARKVQSKVNDWKKEIKIEE